MVINKPIANHYLFFQFLSSIFFIKYNFNFLNFFLPAQKILFTSSRVKICPDLQNQGIQGFTFSSNLPRFWPTWPEIIVSARRVQFCPEFSQIFFLGQNFFLTAGGVQNCPDLHNLGKKLPIWQPWSTRYIE